MKKKVFLIIVIMAFLVSSGTVYADYQLLIDHTSTNLSLIPVAAIDNVKANLHIAYQHTSHGSQLITGMNALESYPDFGTTYEWSDSGSSGLDLDDYGIPGIPDLSQGDSINSEGVTPWVTATRNLLDDSANSHVNVIVWSWCSINGHDAQRYVDNMEILIGEYPSVDFIFMTGHAEGQGETSSVNNVHYNNQLIRAHCFANSRILYDFADIESYNPGNPATPDAPGYEYFWDQNMRDNLDYTGGNWATEWLALYPDSELAKLTTGTGVDGYDGCTGCAHSSSPSSANLNCVLKGRAAWWLWAKLAGWEACTPPNAPSGLSGMSSSNDISLSWTDNSDNEDSFLIQRRVDSNPWENAYQTVTANTVSFIDASLVPGTYSYRVLAYNTAENCYSAPTNTVSVEMISTDPPPAPVLTSVIPDSAAGSIALSWSDVTNETGYTIQQQFNSGGWNETYASVSQNSVSFTDINLLPGSYQYRLTADNSNGSSPYSNEMSAVITNLPASPSSLTATADTINNTISLSWTDNSDNETGFRIQRQVNSGTWDTAYDSVGANVSVYTDDNKGAGELLTGEYTYSILAFNDDGDSASSNESSAVISTLVPEAPSGLVSSLAGDAINLSWADNSDNEVSFIIERKAGSGSFTPVVTLAENSVSWSDTGLAPGTYTYRVNAENSNGASLYSNETSKDVAPVTTTLTLQGESDVLDAFLTSSAPDTNYGSQRYTTGIIINAKHYVVKFIFPAELDGKRILEAKLGIYGWGINNFSAGQLMDFYAITTPWDEGTVTWNAPWTTPGGDYGDLIGQSEITNVDHLYFPEADLTETVKKWVAGDLDNNGFILINNTTTDIGLKAAEYENGNSQSTYLSITYTSSLPGDVNMDYVVDLKDVIVSLQGLSSCCSPIIDVNADVNGDGKIGLAETIYILQEISK